MTIAKLDISDYDELYKLWLSESGIGLNPREDSREGIDKYLRRNPNTSFKAIEDGKLIGAIMCGHDGRRGMISHTVVAPEYRHKGVGKALVAAVMDALRKEGIHKAFLVAFAKNESGNAFWESEGFTLREDLNYRNKFVD